MRAISSVFANFDPFTGKSRLFLATSLSTARKWRTWRLGESVDWAFQYSASDSWEVGPGDYILQAGVPNCGGHEFDAIGAAAQAITAYRMGGVYGSLASVLTTAANGTSHRRGASFSSVKCELGLCSGNA